MKTRLFLLFALIIISCSSGSSNDDNFNYPTPTTSSGSCTYNGHSLHVGEEGGCYYINSSGNKSYVDRLYCASCN